MPSMEDTFEAACAAKEIPGVVLLATDRTGTINELPTYRVRKLAYHNLQETSNMPKHLERGLSKIPTRTIRCRWTQ